MTQQLSRVEASSLQITEGLLRMIAGITYLIPQVGSPVALKYGGKELGDSLKEFAEIPANAAKIKEAISGNAGLEATFLRRSQEWKQQLLLAKQELKQVHKQQTAAEIRKHIAEKDLEIHLKNVDQAAELAEFYKNKFTNLGLYNYLSTSLSQLYNKAYGLAYDLSTMAERAYRFETDDSGNSFINKNWDRDHSTLLAGERLHLQLQQLEEAYIRQNTRDYEITQAFSLALLDPRSLLRLRQTGNCSFEIPEIMFDLFYPGQYHRVIKSVRITIPCVAGPNINISARLTLMNAKIRKEDKIDRSVNNLSARDPILKSIWTSTGQNDSGMFELNFRDERYLAFEGAGAVDGTWALELPSIMRSFDYETMSDVILHISYSARDGTTRSKQVVEAEIAQSLSTLASVEGFYRVFSLKHEFPDSYYKLLHPQSATTPITTSDQTTEFELTKNHFPYFLWDKTLNMSSLVVYLKPRGTGPVIGIKLQINGKDTGSWNSNPSTGNLRQSEVSDSGNPLKKWTIKNIGTKRLDDDTLDDILILVKYKLS